MQPQAVRTTLSIDGDTYRALVDLARENERSASAEARFALRKHLERANVNTDLAAATADGLADTAGSASGGSMAVDSETLVKRGRLSARTAGRAHETGPGHGDPD